MNKASQDCIENNRFEPVLTGSEGFELTRTATHVQEQS